MFYNPVSFRPYGDFILSQLILIDGDIIVYKTAFGVETPIYVAGGGVYIRKGYAERIAKQKGVTVKKRVNVGSEQTLRKKLDANLKQMFDDLESHNYKMYLTASKVEGNFRSKLSTLLPYKGNRSAFIKPVHYNRLREILVKEYGAILVEGQEADDALAIEQTKHFNTVGHWESTIIATIDKDLKTVPGRHYHFTNRSISYVDEDLALRTFSKQLLIGDDTDNIPGITKILKILGREEESKSLTYGHYIKKYDEATREYTGPQCFDYVKGIYEGLNIDLKYFHEIGNLLHLRRYEGQIWSDDL